MKKNGFHPLRCYLIFTTQQLDGLVVGRKSIELEKKTLMEGLEASKRVTEAARRESSFLEKQLEELDRRFQSSQRETRAAEEKLQVFLMKAAGLLQGTTGGVVEPTERDVLHAVENICHKVTEEGFGCRTCARKKKI